MIAVLRCFGSKENAPQKIKYEGAATCAFAHGLYSGESGCPYGCLGLGDCVVSCDFDALYMDEKTGLPVVDADKCVACGACVKACPQNIITMVPEKSKVVVKCSSLDKGAVTIKACDVGCIGCGKCVKVCNFDAITIENVLAVIDPIKCKNCGLCVQECPTGAINSFKPIKYRQPKKAVPKKTPEEIAELKAKIEAVKKAKAEGAANKEESDPKKTPEEIAKVEGVAEKEKAVHKHTPEEIAELKAKIEAVKKAKAEAIAKKEESKA
jgi:ferredoxin